MARPVAATSGPTTGAPSVPSPLPGGTIGCGIDATTTSGLSSRVMSTMATRYGVPMPPICVGRVREYSGSRTLTATLLPMSGCSAT
ncbi:MAG TPA: hypothetical protein VHB97_06475 [Polyangia bacterium]|nr:hypothetical protein [Polyangia bacterium]